jgi:hypothetical protein
MARYSALRASDADREQVAERLRNAAADGRLLAEELEQRMAIALRARTYGELSAVISDLPRSRPDRRRRSTGSLVVRSGLAVAIVLAATVVILFAVLVIVGVIAAWGLWILIAWWCFGGRHAQRRRRAVPRGANWQVSRQAERRAWL